MRKGRTPENLDRPRELELQAEFERDLEEDHRTRTTSMKAKMSCHCDLFFP
ncbi:protein of unknown function [Ruminococcaceae bacterium BL-6]|nr:protein of unknown function [Ruminococcaceae bacterium BL-6]